jgi:hypothetical protein
MFGVELLDSWEAFEIKSSEEAFKNGVDVDTPEITVVVDFGLKSEHEFGEGIEIVRDFMVFGETIIGVQEEH